MPIPRVIIHNAVSVDGRIDWFTPDLELFYGLAGQWKEHATLAGADTFLKAYTDAKLPVHSEETEQPVKNHDDTRPLLVVPDSRGRLRNIWSILAKEPYWRDVVVLCSKSTPQTYLDYLKDKRLGVIISGDDHVDFKPALEALYSENGIKVIRVDSGGTLNGVLLRAGLVAEVSVLIHPALVGGSTPCSIFRAPDLISSEGVIKLKLIQFDKVKDDIIRLRYDIAIKS